MADEHTAPISGESFAVQARGLTRRFGDFTAVDGIDFDVAYGEIFGFLGPNGSGKTTTIRMMLGLLAPTAGTVEVLGRPLNGSSREHRRRIGYMSQRFSLYNDLTVLQNLNFYGKAYGLDDRLLAERIAEALEMSGLQGREHSLTRELSGGWRQRLALSAAILHRPEIVFLDEPTAGVDPVSRRKFWDLLYFLSGQGITVFVTTHYMDEAEHCQRLAFLQRGQIIAYGSPLEIKQDAHFGDLLELVPSDSVEAVKALRAARDAGDLNLDAVELYGSLVHVRGERANKQISKIRKTLKQAGIDPGEISPIEPSLEDVFIASMR